MNRGILHTGRDILRGYIYGGRGYLPTGGVCNGVYRGVFRLGGRLYCFENGLIVDVPTGFYGGV